MDFNLEGDDKILLGENEKGFEFFLSKNLTKYAKDQGLEDINIIYVKKKDAKNYESIVIVKDKVPIFEARTIDAIGTRLDILKLVRDYE